MAAAAARGASHGGRVRRRAFEGQTVVDGSWVAGAAAPTGRLDREMMMGATLVQGGGLDLVMDRSGRLAGSVGRT